MFRINRPTSLLQSLLDRAARLCQARKLPAPRPRPRTRGGFRTLALEALETREVLATVTGASFLATGTMAVGTTSLQVEFSEAVLGGANTANFQVQAAGLDGLLRTPDDVISTLSAAYDGTTTTLDFSALTEGLYRLTVRDFITDAEGVALDGDGNGAPGGNFIRDFVVGADATTLTSANGLVFDPEFGGFAAGQLVQGPNNAFDGLNQLRVNGVWYEPTLPGSPVFDDAGQTLVTPEQEITGLTVHREITVPNDGTHDFARTVEVLVNSTASDIAATVRFYGNLGSGAATTVFATSDGDTLLEMSDQWIGTDDGDGVGTPAIVHYLHGPDGVRPFDVYLIGDNIGWAFQLTVAAGATVRLETFTILATSRAAAVAAAGELVMPRQFGGQAAALQSVGELESLANFQFNDPPQLAANTGTTTDEGAATTITTAMLQATDPDNTAAQLIYTIVDGPTHGTVMNNGAALTAGQTFTQAAVDGGLVSYSHDGGETTSDSFTFTVADDAGVGVVTTSFAIAVNPTNDAPVFADRVLSVFQKAKAGTVVGTVAATDAEGNALTYSLVSGGNGAFAVDAAGMVTVVDPSKLVGPSMALTVRATDNGSPQMFDEAVVTINLKTADTPPVAAMTDGSGNSVAVNSNKAVLTIDENGPGGTQNGRLIGTITFTDADAPGATFAAVMTDRSGAFAFNQATGQITVVDASKLNFEKSKKLTLTFTAVGQKLPGVNSGKTTKLTVTLNLNDRNEAPTIATGAMFATSENNKAGSTVATVKAVDPDKIAPNKTLNYSIVSQKNDAGGDVVGVFAIDGRGKIIVPQAKALDFEASKFFTLVVCVTDGGGLTAEQTITVNVLDANDAPAVALLDAAQNPIAELTVPESAGLGAVIGFIRVTNPDAAAETLSIKGSFSPNAGLMLGPVNPGTGLAAITVVDVAKFDFETLAGNITTLTATASDSGFANAAGKKQSKTSTTAKFTIRVTDVPE